MKMKVKPLFDRVLIKRVEADEKVKGGIIIPDTAKEKPMEGKVIAVGAGRLDDDGKRIPMEVKAGDRILFGKYAGTEIKIDDEEHIILGENEILGIIHQDRNLKVGNTKGDIKGGPEVVASVIYADEIRANSVVAEHIYVRNIRRR